LGNGTRGSFLTIKSNRLLANYPRNFVVIGIALVFIAQLAFCIGMPFPLGLNLLGDKSQNLIPRTRGVNGCDSVLSEVLATLLAIILVLMLS
jgi:hypothetical protein